MEICGDRFYKHDGKMEENVDELMNEEHVREHREEEVV